MTLWSLPPLHSFPQEIADRAATEGRELTTRERIYSILLEQRGKQIAPEYSIKESLTPAREEIQVADKEVFAVVEIKGYQHKVHPDDILYTQKVRTCPVDIRCSCFSEIRKFQSAPIRTGILKAKCT